jgi:hypothetical protein
MRRGTDKRFDPIRKRMGHPKRYEKADAHGEVETGAKAEKNGEAFMSDLKAIEYKRFEDIKVIRADSSEELIANLYRRAFEFSMPKSAL